jgi:uncharacterized membrane protein
MKKNFRNFVLVTITVAVVASIMYEVACNLWGPAEVFVACVISIPVVFLWCVVTTPKKMKQ